MDSFLPLTALLFLPHSNFTHFVQRLFHLLLIVRWFRTEFHAYSAAAPSFKNQRELIQGPNTWRNNNWFIQDILLSNKILNMAKKWFFKYLQVMKLSKIILSNLQCCLGTLIAAAIWPAVMQFTLLFKYWKLSKWDALVFLAAYLLTIFLDIGLALAVGVIISLFGIISQSYRPYCCLLGNVPNTDLYLDLERYKAVNH